MIGNALEGAKAVAKLAQEYGKMDLYQQAVDLMAKVTELAQENYELKMERNELRAKLDLRDSLVPRGNEYFLAKDGREDGPFCMRCYDSQGKLIRKYDVANILGKPSGKRCPECSHLLDR